MQRHLWLPLLALALGLGVLAAAPSPAGEPADKADAAQIKKLIEQMGSAEFDEREKATAALDAIGGPALDALRKAQKSDDAEIRRRAEDLVKAIDKRVESVTILAAKKVHLVYKDTPVGEAVEDFKKKSGYAITLNDPENKLKDRKVTLDTGEVTFWQAFDQFCDKAGVKEATFQDLIPAPAVPLPPGLPIRPVPPIKPLPIRDEAAAVPLAAPPAAPNPPTVAAPPGATPPAVGAPAVGAPAIGIAVPPGVGIAVPPGGFRMPNLGSDQITLVDGKTDATATDASTAVRVRALAKADQFGPAADGEILIGLQLSVEPKLQWQSVEKVTVTKAVDDVNQTLAQTAGDVAPALPGIGFPGGGVAPPGAIAPVPPGIVRPIPLPAPFPGPFPGGFLGGIHQTVAVHLKKGDKAAKSLKELTGTVTAHVLSEPTPIITATEVLKAAGKEFKGGENGLIKIVEATKDANGQFIIKVEMTPPTDVVPVNGPLNGPGFGPGPIILPKGALVPPAPAPAAPPAAVPPPPPAGGAAAGGGVAIGIAIAPGAIVVGPGFGMNMPGAGLSLQDDKGNAFTQVGMQTQYTKGPAGLSMQYVLTFQPQKDQGDAAKLVYMARKSVAVEIPFTLKDVTLP